MLRSLKISLIVLFNFTGLCDDHFIETLGEAASGEPRAQFELGLHYSSATRSFKIILKLSNGGKNLLSMVIRKLCMN